MPVTKIIYAGWTAFWPQFMHVRDTAVARFLRRFLRNDDIVTYWHSATKNWVLGVMDRKRGQDGISELKVINKAEGFGPCVLTKDKLIDILEKCFPDHEDKIEGLRQVERDAISEDEMELEKLKMNTEREEFVWNKLRVRHDPHRITMKQLKELGVI